jgi:hypothetical protein
MGRCRNARMTTAECRDVCFTRLPSAESTLIRKFVSPQCDAVATSNSTYRERRNPAARHPRRPTAAENVAPNSPGHTREDRALRRCPIGGRLRDVTCRVRHRSELFVARLRCRSSSGQSREATVLPAISDYALARRTEEASDFVSGAARRAVDEAGITGGLVARFMSVSGLRVMFVQLCDSSSA